MDIGDWFFYAVLVAWSLFWKGIALWRASKGHQRNWFIALIAFFYVNTIGIFELIYLFKFAKHRLTIHEVKSWLQRKD